MLALGRIRRGRGVSCSCSGVAIEPSTVACVVVPLVVLGLARIPTQPRRGAAAAPMNARSCFVRATPRRRSALLAVLLRRWRRCRAVPVRRRTITEPHGNPYHVKLDAQGQPVPFTITAAGFPAGSLVYVEQCDPQPPSATNWAPTRDCDIGIVAGAGDRRPDRPSHGSPPATGTTPSSRSSGSGPKACSAV